GVRLPGARTGPSAGDARKATHGRRSMPVVRSPAREAPHCRCPVRPDTPSRILGPAVAPHLAARRIRALPVAPYPGPNISTPVCEGQVRHKFA
ncbi:unnamed protein product, partial [Urochloa humidicola]